MHKYRDSDIKPFEFSDLSSSHVVSGTKFEAFSFKTIEGEPFNANKVSEDAIRTERSLEIKNNFKIDGIVREYRGLSRQEQTDLEQKIQLEVEKRLEQAYKEAYQEGLSRGHAEGLERAKEEFQSTAGERLDEISSMVTEVQDQAAKVFEKNRNEIYEFIKRFTKWIVLKEIDEKTYLENLLEKLILETNARRNIIIKVGKEKFSQMPEIVSVVESRLGQLTNTRIEIVPEIHHPGIILETENGLIDGSIEGVFQNIDKIFEQAANNE
jgi:flagellar assembly protein FliH